MTLTKNDVRERLKEVDFLELCDRLELTNEDIIERCDDLVDEKYEQLLELVDWE